MAETDRERAARQRREREASQRRADENATRRAESDARAAEAKAKADAAVAEAAAKRVAAEAAARETEARIKAEADKRAAEAEEAEKRRKDEADKRAATEARAREAMPWQIATSITAVPAGIAAGVAMSKAIEARHTKTVSAANKQITRLGEKAAALVEKVPDTKKAIGKRTAAQLTAVVATADKIGLGKLAKGPLGLTPAALLLAEAALVRFSIAPQIQDERAKAVVSSVASASVFAATNLIGERLIQNATPKKLLEATSLHAIETARNLVAPATKAAPSTVASVAAKVAPIAGKVIARALPVAAAAFAVWEGIKGYQQGGAAGAAVAVADSLTFGGFSAGKAYLTEDAAKKAAAAAPPVAPAASPGAPDASAGARQAYTTADGRTVEGTAGQIAAWENRRNK